MVAISNHISRSDFHCPTLHCRLGLFIVKLDISLQSERLWMSLNLISGLFVRHFLGDQKDAETVFLVRGRETSNTNYSFVNFRVEPVGSYIFVVTKIGITLMWDKGTFLEVQLSPHFKGQVRANKVVLKIFACPYISVIAYSGYSSNAMDM